MTRSAARWLAPLTILAIVGTLPACGRYGPPVRAKAVAPVEESVEEAVEEAVADSAEERAEGSAEPSPTKPSEVPKAQPATEAAGGVSAD